MKFRRPSSTRRNDLPRAILSAVFLGCALHVGASPADTACIDYRDYLHLTFFEPVQPPVAGLGGGAAVIGDIAYAPSYTRLLLYDVSDPAEPVLINTVTYPLPFQHAPTNFVVHGSLGFVTAGYSQGSVLVGNVLLFDLQDPENPVLLVTVETPTKTWDVAATQDYAYVACTGGRFAILDINPPQSASLLSTFATGGGDVRGITLLDGVLHVAAGTKGLRSYSLANPLAPVLLDTSTVPAGEKAVDVAHDGDSSRLVMVVHEQHPFSIEGRLDLFDVTTPSSIVSLGSAALLGPAEHVLVQDNLILAAVNDLGDGSPGRPGLETVDMTDPQNPTRMGAAAFSGRDGSGLAALPSGDSLFLVQAGPGIGLGSVKTIDISNPASAPLLGTGIAANLLGSDGDHLFLGVGAEVQIRDATSVPNLPLIGSVEISGEARGIDVSGSVAVAWPWADAPGYLDVLDLSNPANPGRATLVVDARVVSADIEGSVACTVEQFEADWGVIQGMRVVDVSDPSNPQSVFELAKDYHQVVLRPGFAYFAASSRIDIYDVSDPAATYFVDQVSAPGIQSITMLGELLYVSRQSAFEIYDLADRTAPTLVASTILPSGTGSLVLDQGMGYATAGIHGMYILDLANPQTPAYVASFANGGMFRAVRMAAGTLFVGVDPRWFGVDSDIFIASPQCPATTTDISPVVHDNASRIAASPNPFRSTTLLSYALPHATAARLTVHDVAGRLVRELHRGPRQMGQHVVDWDGRDAHGAQVSAGVYYARLSVAGATRTLAIVRLR